MNCVREGVAAALFLLLVFLSPAGEAASCPGGGPRPGWISSPESITEEHFWAAGVSSQKEGPLADRLATAKQDALKNLSEVLQVTVRNQLVLEQQRQQKGSAVLTDSNLRSLTETSTNASLQNVETMETWEDPGSCQVWVRVRVDRKMVGARQLFVLLSDRLEVAQNASKSLDERQTAYEGAVDVLPRITLNLVPEASSSLYYGQLLKRIGDSLRTAQGDVKEVKTQMDEAERNLNRSAEQTAEAGRSKLQLAVINTYRTLLTRFPSGLSTLFGPGDLLMKLGEIEEIRGNTCGAKSYYQQAVDAKQVVDRKATAAKRVEGLSCSASDMEKTVWRQFFEGRSLRIVCLHNTEGSPSSWPKACDQVGNIVRSLGAEINMASVQLSPGQTQQIMKGEIPSGLGTTGEPVLGYVASGKMTTRQADGGKEAREYRFEGMIWTLLLDDGKAVYSDRFQGTTGWNPISPEMVMDVLGLNVVKRWQDRFSRFLRHELNQ